MIVELFAYDLCVQLDHPVKDQLKIKESFFIDTFVKYLRPSKNDTVESFMENLYEENLQKGRKSQLLIIKSIVYDINPEGEVKKLIFLKFPKPKNNGKRK